MSPVSTTIESRRSLSSIVVAQTVTAPATLVGGGAGFALAALSGLLCLAASPPVDCWPLAFVSWAPLLVALHRASPRRAFLLGGVRELVYYLIGLGWMPSIIRTFGELPWIACWLIALVLFAYGAGRTGAMAWLAARAERKGWPRGAAFVLALVATEGLYPILFPWYAAIQVHRVPVLMQLAEIGGPVLVGVPLAMSSVAVAELAWARLDRRPVNRARVAVAFAGPAVMLLFGAWRVRAVEARMAAAPRLEVGIIQANAPHEGLPLQRAIALHSDATRRLEADHKLDLVLWPETALSGAIATEGLEPMLHSITTSPTGAPLIAAPLLTGAAVKRGTALTNSAVLYADNAVRGTYDKTHPLAFGEYIPFGDVFPVLHEWIPNAGTMARGTHDEPLPLGAHRISTLICYEDILAGPANRAIAHADPDLIVNLTNDAWFGDSTAAVSHLALAKFRAVEHRRYLVHATNSGVSAFVDPTGRATGLTPMLEAATAVGTLRWMHARTVYERVGDAPWWLAGVAIGFMGLVARRPRQTTSNGLSRTDDFEGVLHVSR
jgi:apolipoprotein N-acyltransferase